MKKILYFFVALAVAAGFSSCSGDGTLPDPPIPAKPISPTIIVTYTGDAATVTIPDSIRTYANRYLSVSVCGADVTITNADSQVSELEVVLSGTSNDGSITYNGSYKCTFVLDNLNLTSAKGSPLDIQCGKRVAMVLEEGSVNSLTDAATGTQKACLYCKGHLEVEGSGTLNITANARHGISSKEYLQLKKSTGTINFLSVASDAIHVGQYFQMNGGTININENTAADGIQVETITLEDGKTPDPEEENNGQIIINGGNINAVITAQDCKALKCDGDISINGGTLLLTAQGDGSRGIQTDSNVTIDEAENATTEITIYALGNKCSLPECAADPHRCMGMKMDGDFTMNAGSVTVVNTGKKSRGIRVGGVFTHNGGTLDATVE